jgi:serine/threonine protein kinase/Tfp pilus assembly protein PilF
MHQGMQITNRYRIISKLGQGGMGAVWRVYDRLEKSEVALKQVLIPDKQLDFASKAGTHDTDKLRLSLAQEFSILATLRHPHILSVLDFGFDSGGHPFYTMTLLEGATDCKTYGIDLARSRRIVLMGQMLQALHYLHRRGILHRDLKPDNIFVTRDEQVKVMDFGLAKQDKAQSSQSDTIVGTINYMAPELFQGESASVASDLFAVGVMVYEIMVGQHPFAAQNIGERIMKIMTHTPDFSSIPDNFVPWLQTILEKKTANRFPTSYDAMIEFYKAVGIEMPAETQLIRESFLQASEFVGRDSELKHLTDALGTINTKNAFFLVGGESGVGKSRLLEELRVRAVVTGAVVLRGQGVEGGGLPFQLWRNIVRQMLLMVKVTDLQAGILKDIVPDIDALLQRDIANAPELIGKAYQDRIALAIIDLFRNLPQPVVLLLEDLQWTSESLVVLQQMLELTEQLPKLMVVAAYRDDEAPQLPEKLTGMTHIKLERLNPDAVSELSRAILGDAGKNEDVVRVLHSQSEGNLFFLVETVRALAEASGELQRIGEGNLPESVFTGGMQALTRRRLSKVDAQYAQIQTLAAIIGREIDTKLLNHAYNEATVQSWLSNAADYNVVSIQDNTWRFAHDKLRETIIADIPGEILPSIHRTAATTIETVYPGNDAYNKALFAHWQQAGELDKEWHYLDGVIRPMVFFQGNFSAATDMIESILAQMASDDARRALALDWRATIYQSEGNYAEAREVAETARQIAESGGNNKSLAQTLGTLGLIAGDVNDYALAIEYFERSLSIREQIGDQKGIAFCTAGLGMIALQLGDVTLAAERYQFALSIYEALGDQANISTVLNNLGIIAIQKGDYTRAYDLLQQSMTKREKIGNQIGTMYNIMNLGRIARDLGDYTRARTLYEQCLALARRFNIKHLIAGSFDNLSIVDIELEDYAQASQRLQQTIAAYQSLDDKYGVASSISTMGILAEKQADYLGAREHYQRSITLAREISYKLYVSINANHLAWVALKQNEQGASAYLCESLRLGLELQIPAIQLLNILGFSWVLQQVGKRERSAQLMGLAKDHPAAENFVRWRVSELMPQLESALPPDELRAALEHGKKLDLDTVVQELLAEFGDDKRDVSRRNPWDT